MSMLQHTVTRWRTASTEPHQKAEFRKADQESWLKFVASVGASAWARCDHLWVNKFKKPANNNGAVTEKLVLDKLRQGKSLEYSWFIADGYAGEGRKIKLEIQPTDGVLIRWWRETQMGDLGSHSADLNGINMVSEVERAFLGNM